MLYSTWFLKAAGIPGHFTNHSLRVTSATRLFEAHVDEQLIYADDWTFNELEKN